MGMISEFKEFIARGNVIDLAIAVVIGTAFGKIVTSLVNDVIMPAIGAMLGGFNFSAAAIMLEPARIGPDGAEIAAVMLRYGMFIQAILDFLIVAFVIFLAVKAINRLKRQPEAAAEPEAPSAEVLLLTEIRDALKR